MLRLGPFSSIAGSFSCFMSNLLISASKSIWSILLFSKTSRWSPTEIFSVLYSEFSVILAFIHLYTLFMIVPIFNSLIRIDKSLIEAAYDSGANGFQILTNIIIPLCKPGIIIGSIFVITVVMGDFLTIGIMGGQQIASIGKIIQVEMSYLQLPAAAANAVILLFITLLLIWTMTKFIDIRKEL